MNYFLGFILSIILTSSAYFFGSLFIGNSIAFWQALVIGGTVVSFGAIAEGLGAPIWLIVLIPFPVGMFLLYLFLNESFITWLVTYFTILALYTVIHVIMSYFFRFHSLIPAWKLSS
jgi:hypothetical protein